MADEDITQILKTFDLYLKLIENPLTNQNINCDNIVKVFNCCMFVETAIARVNEENQIKNFESHLHGHWKKMKRTHMYTCCDLKSACDKLLEIYLKCPNINTDLIDKFLQLYVQNLGQNRLKLFFDNMLPHTLSGNNLINSMIELGLSNSIIEDEVRIIAWKNMAACGKINEIYEAINQMIDQGHVKKILEYILIINENDVVEKLIIDNLTQRTNSYDIPICMEIIKIKRKLLRRLLKNLDFQISFMDAVFYFGRSMIQDKNGHWKSNNSFTYRHLVKIMNNLLTITRQIGVLTNQRLKLAKAQVDGAIWLDIENDCLE